MGQKHFVVCDSCAAEVLELDDRGWLRVQRAQHHAKGITMQLVFDVCPECQAKPLKPLLVALLERHR